MLAGNIPAFYVNESLTNCIQIVYMMYPLSCKEDKDHFIYFEEISTDILNNVSGNNIEYVKAQLEKIDDNIMECMNYWFEKYYRNGFCDAVKLISGCLR